MWVYDLATLRFLEVNVAAVRQYGYSRDEFLDCTILDLRPPGETGDLCESPGPRHIALHRRRDTSLFLAEVEAHDIVFDGHPARLVLALDVNARERNAEMVRRTNRTLGAVLKAAPVGLVVFDDLGRVDNANDAARRMVGEEGFGLLEERVNAAREGTSLAPVEMATAQGWIEVTARPFDLGEGKIGVIAVLSEATERRREFDRLSHELEDRREELRAAEEELDGFCFSVSHDLRGPLRAIDGFAQMVLTDSDAMLSEENQDALRRVRRAAGRMGELIDGLLLLSRLARAAFAPEWVDLSTMAFGTARRLQAAHPDRTIVFEIEPNLWVYGDPQLVASLLERLLENAVKFTARVPMARVELFGDGMGWAVRDNGAGFDPAFSNRLFKPFERLHTTTDFPGNGLGLAVVDRIVRRHGGRCWAEGRPGGGATFRIVLPGDENAKRLRPLGS